MKEEQSVAKRKEKRNQEVWKRIHILEELKETAAYFPGI
jgi:hypothetical protein